MMGEVLATSPHQSSSVRAISGMIRGTTSSHKINHSVLGEQNDSAHEIRKLVKIRSPKVSTCSHGIVLRWMTTFPSRHHDSL